MAAAADAPMQCDHAISVPDGLCLANRYDKSLSPLRRVTLARDSHYACNTMSREKSYLSNSSNASAAAAAAATETDRIHEPSVVVVVVQSNICILPVKILRVLHFISRLLDTSALFLKTDLRTTNQLTKQPEASSRISWLVK